MSGETRRTGRAVVQSLGWTTRPSGRKTLVLTVSVDQSAVAMVSAGRITDLTRITTAIRELFAIENLPEETPTP